jgi:hypothetical protein
MTRTEVSEWLLKAGWFKISGEGNGCWLAPGWQHLGGGEYWPAQGETKFFSWEQAIRRQLILEERYGRGR